RSAVFSPSQPPVSHVETHTLPAQAMHPCPQQRRCLHAHREYSSRGALKGFHAQTRRPVAQSAWRKTVEHGLQLRLTIGEPCAEGGVIFRVGQVEPTDAGP